MPYVTALPLLQESASSEASDGASPHRSTQSGQCTVQPDRARDSVPVFAGTRHPQPTQSAGYLLDRGLFRVWFCMVSFWFGVVLGLSAAPTESFRGTLRKVCERCGVCGGKTGLTIQIQNGWRDFRFREKVSEREKTGKRSEVQNKGGLGGVARRSAALERAERGLEREEGSGEGGHSGKGERSAGRGERGAGEDRTRKRPHPVKDAAGVWGEVGLSVGTVGRRSLLAKRHHQMLPVCPNGPTHHRRR